MSLVIVESPTKAKTLGKFLGKKYDVESSYGHVRDLPKGKLGIDEENNLDPQYIIPKAAQKRVNALKKVAQAADEVILATDEDREGEAIAWHLVHALGLKDESKIKRIVFHEITESAIKEAIENPRPIKINLVDAQQARRIIDRLVGYKISPFLWKKVRGGLSAGRVQSVALRLIVDRENEIREFKPEEYWTIENILQSSNEKFDADLVKIGTKKLEKFDIKTARDAQTIANDIKKAKATVEKVTVKEKARRPLPPFITSTLQQYSSRRLRYSAKKTMMIAQKLYEKGHITYMRTDSVSLSKESTTAAKSWLADTLGAQYATAAPRPYRSKSKLAQEAHEAIRPTKPSVAPEGIKLTGDEGKLYDLIWRRFMASQMPDAKFEATSLEIKVEGEKDKYTLKTNGSVMKFDGFLKIWPSKIEEKTLPSIKEGEVVEIIDSKTEQHFTEPPPRYNEASIIKTLEEFEIGRPSTYASIISVIQTRGYVIKDENRRFVPEEIGELVIGLLSKHFPKIVDVDFTASIEEEFDGIANGVEEWKDVVKRFYGPFIENLDKKYEEVKKEDVAIEQTDVDCDKCSRKMIIKFGRYGKFMACPGYPECKNTKTLKEPPQEIGMKCPECKEGEIIIRRTKRKRMFYGCARYPECEYASWKNPKEEDEKKEE